MESERRLSRCVISQIDRFKRTRFPQAIEDGDAEFAFKLLNLPGDRGLGDEQLLRGTGEVTMPAGRKEGSKQVRVHN